MNLYDCLKFPYYEDPYLYLGHCDQLKIQTHIATFHLLTYLDTGRPHETKTNRVDFTLKSVSWFLLKRISESFKYLRKTAAQCSEHHRYQIYLTLATNVFFLSNVEWIGQQKMVYFLLLTILSFQRIIFLFSIKLLL